MRNRRIWAAVFAAIMIFTLVGCGKKPVKNNDMDFDTPTTDGYDKETEESGEGQMDETSDSDYEKETDKPTEAPTTRPEDEATEAPTTKPADKPTEVPTTKPVVKPTEPPTTKPVEKPTQGQTTRTPVVVTKSVTTYPEIQQGYSEVTEADILTVRNIIRSILYTDMSTIERIKTVHDYLVKNTTYDQSYYTKDNSHKHLYNILNEKRAVCQGYAVAFYIFMNELDIPCSIVTGYAGEAHAWNAVKMDDGKWYFVDVTWDDPMIKGTSNYPNGDNLSYTYFLCTNNFITRSHTAEEIIGGEPTVYGNSNEYNNYPYYQMGYKGIYRISTADDLSCVSQLTESGEYMFISISDTVSVDTIMTKIKEIMQPGVRYVFQYGSASVMVTINYAS